MNNKLDFWLDRIAGVLIVAKLVVLAAFALTLAISGPTLAQTTKSIDAASGKTTAVEAIGDPRIICSGVDVLPKLQKDNPEAFAEIKKKAMATLNGQSILWKIEKTGVNPSYLLGTMHLSDKRVTTLSKPAEAAFAGAGTIVIEVTEVLDKEKLTKAMLGLRQYTMLTDGSTLEQKLDQKTIRKLKSRLDGRGVPWFLVKRMQPWMVTAMVAVPACELARKRNNQLFLDHLLGMRARAEGKKLLALETVEEQIKIIAGLSAKFHLSALRETAGMGALIDDMVETMIVLYTKGDTGSVWPLMEYITPKSSKGEGYASFQEAMVDKRNETMMTRAIPIIDAGNAFIAVGALHLPGEKGLVNRLQQAGYTLTAVSDPSK